MHLYRKLSFIPSKAVIVSAKRTPIGSFMGSLSNLPLVYLASSAISSSLSQSKLLSTQITELVLGQALPASHGQSVARQVATNSNLPESVQTFSINKSSASGLKAVTLAAQSISLGHSGIIIAMGVEMMSQAPFVLPNGHGSTILGDGTITDSLLKDENFCGFTSQLSGKHAEETALKFDITREQQDQYSKESYIRAQEAWSRDFFKNEVEKLETFTKRQDPKFVREDEEFRKFQPEQFSKLKPVFDKNGTVTAGNSAKFADGACSIIMMGERLAKKLGIKPLARILGFADCEVEPRCFLESVRDAAKLALKRAGLKIQQIDLFEINEDYSVTVLVGMKQLEIEREVVNVNGGAIAFGHPVGMSGGRIVSTLIYALREVNKRIGVAVVCHGGGGASAVVIEVV